MQREVRIRIGQTGSGKSFGANEFLKTVPRALVLDAGFDEDFSAAAGFYDFEEMVLYLERIGAFQNPDVPFRVKYTPRRYEYDIMFKTAIELQNVWLVGDEADRFGDPEDLPNFDEVLIRGRHHGINLLFLYLYPYAVPIDLRRQMTHLICYRQTEPSDIEWMRRKVGPMAEQLLTLPGPPLLPPHPYLEWGAGFSPKVVYPRGITPPKAVVETPVDSQ